MYLEPLPIFPKIEKTDFIFLDFCSTYGIVLLEQCLKQLKQFMAIMNCSIIKKRVPDKKFFIFFISVRHTELSFWNN